MLSTKTLLSMDYALVEPFLNYCKIAWGNTSQTTTLQPLFILQKKDLGIITFSCYNEHSSPLFKDRNVVKLSDIITLQLAVFMYKFHNNLWPSVFDPYFNSVRMLHNYNTRLSRKMTYVIPKVRTNYGTFNIRFQGPKVWNGISDDCSVVGTLCQKARLLGILCVMYVINPGHPLLTLQLATLLHPLLILQLKQNKTITMS